MTADRGLDSDLAISTFDGETATPWLSTVRALYGQVYAEPPYDKSDADVTSFAATLPRRVASPGFRLALAHIGDAPVGFTFGHQLRPDTQWWFGAVDPLPRDIVTERPGRTFAIIELGVRRRHRRRHVARALHTALLEGRAEERVTLLARPDAQAAQRTYAAWGYRRVGRIQPFVDSPVYDALVRSMRRD